MADAQFAIDIAAEMTDGPATAAELDRLSAKLLGAGKNSTVFVDALARVGQELSGAAAAAKLANAALSEGEAEFKRLERATLQASRAAEKAAAKNAGVVPPDLAAKLAAGNAALSAQANTLRGLEAAAKAAADKEAQLARTQKNLQTLNGHVNRSLSEQAERLSKLRGALGASGGALGALGAKALAPAQGFAELSGAVGATGAAAVVTTVAVVALTAAMVAGVAALTGWAVGLADAARSAALTRQAAEALDPGLAALHGTIDALRGETGLAVPDLQSLAGTLRDATVSAADMPAALRAAALAEAALGKGGASKFIADIRAGKVAVAELSADVSNKLGGIVAQKMRGLDAQGARLKSNLGSLFGGLNIEPILQTFERFVSLFDTNTVLGKELKLTFEALFQPLLDSVPNVYTLVEGFFLDLAIWGVKGYLAITRPSEGMKLLGVAILGVAGAFAATLVPAIVSGAAAAVVAIGGVIATAAVAAAPFLAVGAAVAAVWYAFTHWTEIKEILANVVAMVSTLGGLIIDGLVAGITNGAAALLSAIGGVVTGAIDHAKKLLGIASPSKVFEKLGGFTAEGFAGGVEDTAPEAQSAISGLVAAPSPEDVRQAQLSGNVGALGGGASAAPAAAPAQAASSGGGGINLAGAVFNLYGVENAEDAAAKIGETLTRLLEGDALQLAGATA